MQLSSAKTSRAQRLPLSMQRRSISGAIGAFSPRESIALSRGYSRTPHVAAIGAALADDYEQAKALLGTLLRAYPRDVLPLQVAHGFDYATGDIERMADGVSSVLSAWCAQSPGYHAVLTHVLYRLEFEISHGLLKFNANRSKLASVSNAMGRGITLKRSASTQVPVRSTPISRELAEQVRDQMPRQSPRHSTPPV